MKQWIKAGKFVISFMCFCYWGGAMMMAGAHTAAKVIGVSAVIVVDNDAGGE